MKQDKTDFSLTVEECKLILDNIDGLIVVDNDGQIRYMSEDMQERIAVMNGDETTEGLEHKNIRDIHPASKLIDLLGSKNMSDSELAIYSTMGFINISKIKKLYDNNKMIGAIDFDLFCNASELKELFDKLKGLAAADALDFDDSIDLITIRDKRLKDIKYSVSDILGESKAIVDLKKSLFSIADSESTVLIEAETGCGKELVAHSIHNLSRRTKNPLIEINCAAIPESLFESELFGYEEGTFTGAQRGGKAGKLELAEKGTLFLDEVDQIPYHIQPKLLRVLQEREFSRIGGKEQSMNVRIIAASNKNLKNLVKEGKFREDLYYRLNVIKLAIPTLKERKEDIPLLVKYFINQMNGQLGKDVKDISPQVKKLFYEYSWPGNVRELRNLIERAMNLCRGKYIEMEDLGDFAYDISVPDLNDIVLSDENPLEKAKELVEKKMIEKALYLCGGNKRKTAQLLKISRSTLYTKLEKMSE